MKAFVDAAPFWPAGGSRRRPPRLSLMCSRRCAEGLSMRRCPVPSMLLPAPMPLPLAAGAKPGVPFFQGDEQRNTRVHRNPAVICAPGAGSRRCSWPCRHDGRLCRAAWQPHRPAQGWRPAGNRLVTWAQAQCRSCSSWAGSAASQTPQGVGRRASWTCGSACSCRCAMPRGCRWGER